MLSTNIKVELADDTKELIEKLTAAVENLQRDPKVVTVTNSFDAIPALYHDDKTLQKVYDAIQKACSGDGAVPTQTFITDVINEMQNAGIVFREVRSKPADSL